MRLSSSTALTRAISPVVVELAARVAQEVGPEQVQLVEPAVGLAALAAARTGRSGPAETMERGRKASLPTVGDLLPSSHV